MQVTWEMLEDAVSDCRGCVLCQTRQHTVLGEGSRNADVMFVGEGPGQQEDEQGRPSVGPAGQLLDKMLAAIGLDRSVVYIAIVFSLVNLAVDIIYALIDPRLRD